MIYLDYAATTPPDPAVVDAMWPYLREHYGNASSLHAFGRAARQAVDEAREAVAAALHADFAEVVFTSGGTEADNLAVLGALRAAPANRDHLIVSAIEHPAVLRAADEAERLGFSVTRLKVDGEGRVSPDSLGEALTDRTALVSIQHANNEIGVVQDIARLARLAHERGALFHADAVQSFPWLPIHVRGLEVDLLTISAHKVHGPKGVGALFVRSGTPVAPLNVGGAQERELRAGTENVPGIVGFGVAAKLLTMRREEDVPRVRALRDELIAGLHARVRDLRLNGPRDGRLPNIVNVSTPGVDGAALVLSLDRAGVAVSSGSACSSGAIEPSHVLQAIGLPRDLAASGLRFSLGRTTTLNEVQLAVDAFEVVVERLRRTKR